MGHSTFLLVQASMRLHSLKSIAEETTGIRDEVGRLQGEYDALHDKATQRLTRMHSLIPSLATNPAAFNRILLLASSNDSEIGHLVSQIDNLLARVVEKIQVVEAERGSAVKGAVGAGINIAQNVIYGGLSVATPGGWAMAIAGLTANAIGGAVATTTLVIEIVSVVKCSEILAELSEMESQLSETRREILKLRDQTSAIKGQLATSTGDDDL